MNAAHVVPFRVPVPSLFLATVILTTWSVPGCAVGVSAERLRSLHSPAQSLVEKVTIFGKDTRSRLPERYRSLDGPVGLLTSRDRRGVWYCTAFCVTPNIIATGAHCLVHPVDGGRHLNLKSFRFRSGRGRKARQSRIAGRNDREAQWNVIAGSTSLQRGQPANLSHDWAIAKLASPVCRGRVLKLKALKKDPDLFDAIIEDQAFIVAYQPVRRHIRLRYAGKCLSSPAQNITLARTWELYRHMTVDPDLLVQHNCDMTQGASGSPLLLDRPDGPYAVAVNVLEVSRARARRYMRKQASKSRQQEIKEFISILTANSAVSVGAFEKQLDLLRHDTPPLDQDRVRLIQSGLRASGHYAGKIDGIYGRQTRQAILDFEYLAGWLPTGRPSVATVAVHHFGLGQKGIRKKNFEQAIRHLDEALVLNPRFVYALVRRGYAYQRLKQYDRAIADFNAAIEARPRYGHAYHYRGYAYYLKKDYGNAISDLTRAISLRPQPATAYSDRGLAYLAKGELDKALADQEKAVSLRPDWALGHFRRGFCHEKMKSYDKAAADYTKAIKLRKNYALAYFNRGNLFEKMGELDRAIADYTIATSIRKNYVVAFNNRGYAYRQKGDLERAIADYSRAIKLDATYFLAFSNRGLAYSKQNKLDLAIKDYTRAISLKQDYAKAFNNRGYAYKRKGDLERAIADYSRAIKLDESYFRAFNNRGVAYSDQKKFARAIADFNRAIALRPEAASPYNNRAWAYFKWGRPQAGLADVNHALRLKPDNAYALDTRAHIYEALGDKDKAIADFRAAVKLKPDQSLSLEGLRRLGVDPTK